MVTEQVRVAVWSCMLDASRVTRYAETMGARYRLRHVLIRFGLLLAASGSVATVVTALPDLLRAIFGIAIAALVAADFMFDYATKIATLDSAKRETATLESDWQDLWLDVNVPESDDAGIRRRNTELVRRFERATGPMDSHVRVDQKANVESAKIAYKVTSDQYAVS